MIKSLILLPIILCFDVKPTYSRDDVSAFFSVSVCAKEDIKYNLNFKTVAYNLFSVEF